MAKIIFKTTKKLLPTALFDLYGSVGWTEAGANSKKHGALLAKVYANSDLVFSAWDGKILVGTVRAITDKYAHGCIFGLAVRPEYQNQGIGGKLLEMCVRKYPKIHWGATIENPQAAVFAEQGFVKSERDHLEKGVCPI